MNQIIPKTNRQTSKIN